GQTDSSSTVASATPAAKPSESMPAGDTSSVVPEPAAPVASSTDDDTNIGGASAVVNDQSDSSSPAASSTPVAKPSESVPADNSSAVTPTPKDSVASSTNDDTNIGGASEVVNDQTGSSSTVASSTPASEPSEAVPAGDTSTVIPAPTAPVASSTNDDTNIGGASAVVNDQTDNSNTVASSAPVVEPSESVPAGGTSAVAPTTNGSDASSTSETPAMSEPSTSNDAEPSTVVPVNPKDGDQFNGVDPLTDFSYGIFTYQASTGYWLDTYGNDRDPYNPQNIRHTADQIAAAKAADEKAHEIVPGTELTRPDDGDTNIGGASEVINGQTSVSSTATDQAAVSANGKSTTYYGSVEPSHPKDGETWYWVKGDESVIYVFYDGQWLGLVSSNTGENLLLQLVE
uniref:hypothetical protein n=1 Tax=Leuconostoc mesenteroides TaxID=1245 RepID=UPI0023617995